MSGAPPDSAKFVQKLNFRARDAANESAGLHAAFTLGLFDALAQAGDAGATLEELSQKLASVPRGVRSLLEVASGLHYIRFDGNRYALTREAAAFLDDGPFREQLKDAVAWWTRSTELTDAVKHGSEKKDVLEHFRRAFTAELSDSPSLREDFLDRFTRNFLRTQLFVAASFNGLLKALARGESDRAALQSSLKLSAEGLDLLALGLYRMGILESKDGPLRHTPNAAHSLDEKGLPYFERALPATMVYWQGLGELAHSVKTGEFSLDLKRPEVAAKIYGENASRITGIFASHIKLGRHATELVKQMRSFDGAKVLDVGTGSGVWGAAFALAFPSAEVTYLDSDYVLEGVKKNLASLKILERGKLWAADCMTAELGEKKWDAILLPQILPVLQPHERRAFLDRVGRAVAPGGLVAISGYVLSDLRDAPMDAVYFSLRRYMTNEGDVLSFPEMKAELARVGLNEARLYPLPVQELVIGTRGDLPWPREQGRA